MPFDLSDNSGSDQPVSPTSSTPGTPTGRASDLLTGAGGTAPKQPAVSEGMGFLIERPGTPVDGVVTGILYIALLINVISMVYLLFNVWTGAIGDPSFTQKYSHEARLQVMSNINNVDTAVLWSGWISVICTTFLFFDLPYVGYVLILIAGLLNIGVPELSGYFLTLTKSTHTLATDTAISFIDTHWLVPAIFGVPLIILDMVRRLLEAAATVKAKRTTFKYGRGAIKTIEKRNVFLGSCWNMPYCRQISRKRCPVHAKNQGPCWRKKSGCMCEESVSVIATTPGNWRAAVADAVGSTDVLEVAKPSSTNPLLNMAPSGGRTTLNAREKAARCRDCVIYNAHQEQKYKAMALGLVGGYVALLFFVNGPMIDGVAKMYNGLNSALSHFSLATTTATAQAGSMSTTVAWFILVVLSILVVSKLLQLLEYLCFTLKV